MHSSITRRIALAALALLAASASAETLSSLGDNEGAPSAELSSEEPRYTAAVAEIFGSNVVINAVDRFVVDADYAQTDLSSMARNLSSPWVFDNDSFSVNEIAHPYHGSLYFTAGRSNGLDFWSASLGTALGSATWELFGEIEAPSINDIVSTTMGGMVLGEMLHRLYEQARLGHSPLRIVASPMDSLNEALFMDDREVAQVPTRLALSLEAGMSYSELDMAESRGIAPGTTEPLALVGESLSYGDPFARAPSEPFSRFEQRLRLGMSPSSYELTFFSSGSLCSFLLVDEPSWKVSAGASLHYDFIFSSLVDLSANSAGLSLATARRFGRDFSLSTELHLNAVAMGTNENVFMLERSSESAGDSYGRDYDFSFGEGAKLYLRAAQPKLGTLRLEYEGYGLHAIPAALKADSGFDYALVGLLELSYEHRASGHIAAGLAYRLYRKDAFYDSSADVNESMQSVTLFAKFL